MIGSKQTHIFSRKTGQLGAGRMHVTNDIRYDIDYGIDEV